MDVLKELEWRWMEYAGKCLDEAKKAFMCDDMNSYQYWLAYGQAALRVARALRF
jgi:hypothetical protein